MRRSQALLVAIFCAIGLSASAQTIVYFPNVDRYWVIHFRSQTYGLIQYTDTHYYYVAGKLTPRTYTTVCLGSRAFNVNTSVWPIIALLVFCLACLGWLVTYAVGSVFRPDKKPPPPNPSPPP